MKEVGAGMRVFMRVAGVICSILVSGCAMTTDPQEIGPNTYTISGTAAPVRGGEGGARSVALPDAGRYCRSLGRQIVVTGVSQHYVFPANGGADVTFRCLPPGDPGLAASYGLHPISDPQD